MTPQNVTGLISRLADRGLVERRADPRHPHVLEIHLTEQGRSRLLAADAAVDDLEADVVTHLGAEGTRAVGELLHRLAALARR